LSPNRRGQLQLDDGDGRPIGTCNPESGGWSFSVAWKHS